jgi:MtrB/PioB family decaheme-associated outer membrane protein
MKLIKYILIILVVLFLIIPMVFAEEQKKAETTLTASVWGTGTIIDQGGNEAKFNEYRDVQDGFYTGFDIGYRHDGYFVAAESSDIGYDTQSYRIEAGKYGSYRINAYYNEIPHNFTYDARSPYGGIGSSRLTHPATAPSSDISTWNRFDYETERKSYGAGVRLDLLAPFYLNVQFNQEEKEGTFPIGVAGTSPGGIAMELPLPVDWTTTNMSIEAGYTRNPFFFSLSYLHSQFDNDDNNLFFTNVASATTRNLGAVDYYTSAPDNDAYQIDFKGAVRLPYHSSFNVNLSMSEANSDADLLDYYVGSTGLVNVNLSNSDFDGKVETENYSFVLKSNPLRWLEGKIFYTYYNRDNKSERIAQWEDPPEDDVFINSLFDYRKNKYGAELGFKLPLNFFLRGNYTYIDTEREREDIEETEDDLYTVELRWSGFDMLVTRLTYEKLHRVGNSESDVTPFDAASQDRDTLKLDIDFFPLENLNISIGLRKSDSDYDDTVYGLVEETSEGGSLYLDYLIAKRVRLYGNIDYERVEQDQIQDSTSSPDTSWKGKQITYNRDYGIGTEIFIVPNKWTLNLAYNYSRGNGSVDYRYYDIATPANIDLDNWDDYTLKSYKLQLTYNATVHWTFSAGYIFEKYNYDDDQYNGYIYKPGSTVLSGAYADPDYRADMGFLTVRYKF